MKNTICGFDVLADMMAERYVTGELEEVAVSKATEKASAEMDRIIDTAVTSGVFAAKLEEALGKYVSEVMRDAFTAGLMYGIQAGIDSVGRRSGDGRPTE